MPVIHPTAIVDSSAQLADDVRIDAHVIIEGRVSIGAGSRIQPNSILRGHTIIGKNCTIGPAAYVGLDPQHLKFDGGETSLLIGDGTVIREAASVHRASKPGVEHATRVGQRCFIMGSAHVGHDCVLEDDVILAQGALLGGYVKVGARAFVGGGAVVHQFCRIGRLAMISGNEAVSRDIPPFSAVRYNGLKGYNAVGCRRAGMSRAAIHSLRQVFRMIHTTRNLAAVVEKLRDDQDRSAEVCELLEFITTTKRGIQPSVRFVKSARTPEGAFED